MSGFVITNYGFALAHGTVAEYITKQKPKKKPTNKKKQMMKQVAATNKVNEDSMSDYDSKVPAGWELKFIADVCNIYVGRDLKENNFSNSKSEEYQVPVYSNTVENEGLYGYYNIEEFSGESTTIVGRGAGLGTAFTRNGKYGAIGRLLVLFPKENVIAHYITEFVNGILQIHQESGGIPQLTGEQISKYKIKIPPLPEQKAIAQVLSTADTAIHTTEKLIVQKELRKKWLTQQLLTGNKRLKGFGGAWKKCNASDFLSQRNEQAPNNGNIPLFSLTIENGVTEKSERYEREFLVKDKSIKNYKIVYPNDIVFNPANLRWGAIAKHTRKFKVLLSPIYEVLSVKDGFDIDFISYLVSSPRQISYYASILEGTLIERMAVKVEPFLATNYEIPNKEEQTLIAQVLKAADKEISLLKLKAEKLREKKKGLMQQLLTGKIRIK